MGDEFEQARRSALENAETVVFLCSGNMVRSAFAELYARHLGCSRQVRSGATAYRNDRIYPETARALIELGVSAELIDAFRPTHVEDLVPELDGPLVFLGMRQHHLDAMYPWPEHRRRTFLLDHPREIGDPVLEGADFSETFARLATCVEYLVGDGFPGDS